MLQSTQSHSQQSQEVEYLDSNNQLHPGLLLSINVNRNFSALTTRIKKPDGEILCVDYDNVKFNDDNIHIPRECTISIGNFSASITIPEDIIDGEDLRDYVYREADSILLKNTKITFNTGEIDTEKESLTTFLQ